MQLEQQLRDALQRDAAELEPVGPGPDDARRRAFRHKRRLQSGVLVLSAAVLAGGTIAVVNVRPAGDGARVQSQPETPTVDLAWKAVAGTVSNPGTHFTTAAGVTYVLSTAPGSGPDSGDNVPEALYSTRDGLTWNNSSFGATPRVADVAESNGVLYALSTGPTAQGATEYRLASSSDGGAQWDGSTVPVHLAPLTASVPITMATRVQVARQGDTTVVTAQASFVPDYTKKVSITDTQSFQETEAGVQVTDVSSCKGTLKVPPNAKGAVDPAQRARDAQAACQPQVVSTHPWSEFGLSGPAALHEDVALVKAGNGSWNPVPLSLGANTTVQDLTATSHGFLLAAQTWANGPGQTSSTQLLSSADGKTWTPAPNVPAGDSLAIAGDRVVVFDNSTSVLSVSNDAGASWTTVNDLASKLPAGLDLRGAAIDAGPLGFAAVVATGTAPDSDSGAYLLYSKDGTDWKVTDLDKVGAKSQSYAEGVVVGANHIEITFAGPFTDGAKVQPITTLVATPKA